MQNFTIYIEQKMLSLKKKLANSPVLQTLVLLICYEAPTPIFALFLTFHIQNVPIGRSFSCSNTGSLLSLEMEHCFPSLELVCTLGGHQLITCGKMFVPRRDHVRIGK